MMRDYYKASVAKYYALSVVGIIALLALTAYIAGGSVPATWWGFMLLLIDVALPILLALFIARRELEKTSLRILKIYEELCDPRSFIMMSEPEAKRTKVPFGEHGAWLLSYRSLAYGDLADVDASSEALDDILRSIDCATNGIEKANMMLFAYPPAARLFGRAEVRFLLQDAKRIFSSDPERYGDKLDYIDLQERFLAMEENGDLEGLLELFAYVRKDASRTMRERVEAAFKEAKALRGENDAEREKCCLRFVVENGGSLHVAHEAEVELRKLSGASMKESSALR